MARRTTNGRLDLEQIEKTLLAEKGRLLREKEKLELRAARKEELQGEDPPRYRDHIAELGSDAFEREKDLASHASVTVLLEEVELALRKLRENTYGMCDACGGQIGAARLKALPYATLCLECQSRAES